MQSFWACQKAAAFTNRRRRLLSTSWRPIIVVGSLALTLTGCATNPSDITGSLSSASAASTPAKSESDYRKYADNLGAQHRANPRNPDLAIQYAQALRTLGQRPQAVAVLEQTSLAIPGNKALMGAYGRALADAGQHKQALEVLERAHTPENPDWRILSAQGAVLDQLGRHPEAQRYYSSALKIAPEEPSILSNLGLSYALAKDLPKAEATLRRASSGQKIDPRVRQNLALVVGLQGRFAEAEEIAKADLPPEEAASNVAYLRQMLEQQGKTGKKIVGRNDVTGS
ncbi:MAG TPA: tetratricopeptide repeat protein [Xanthobacteraceae bacterium]|nr:tetratricopeptide repeat protein [Xanthobacteraceae bacterium]